MNPLTFGDTIRIPVLLAANEKTVGLVKAASSRDDEYFK
jgi:hypothetical protein